MSRRYAPKTGHTFFLIGESVRKDCFMKVLHTSDWHLGASDGNRSLYEDQLYFIDEICGIIKERDIRAVIIAGDIYDRTLASAEAIHLYDYAMTRFCAELGVSVLSIAGNHDSAERLSSCSDLLKASGLYICGSAVRNPEPVSIENTDFYLLPWITEEKVKSLFPEKKENIESLEDAYRIITGEMKKGFDPAKKHVIISHAYITDSETSTSDRAAEIGFAAQVSADVFDGFDYAALGHIHKPQNVTDRIRYSGTPMPYAFGKEETQEKSVTVFDTETMEVTAVPLHPLHKRRTFTGTFEELRNPDITEEERNGYVRLQVTDCFIGTDVLTALKEIYPQVLEVSGRTFEGENSKVTLTLEELEQMEEDPVEVFRYFCKEIAEQEPDGHFVELFKNAVAAYEEEHS